MRSHWDCASIVDGELSKISKNVSRNTCSICLEQKITLETVLKIISMQWRLCLAGNLDGGENTGNHVIVICKHCAVCKFKKK